MIAIAMTGHLSLFYTPTKLRPVLPTACDSAPCACVVIITQTEVVCQNFTSAVLDIQGNDKFTIQSQPIQYKTTVIQRLCEDPEEIRGHNHTITHNQSPRG